ncbi:MAG: protein-disulfide reductase DsbD [Granulosicoccus sp.]
MCLSFALTNRFSRQYKRLRTTGRVLLLASAATLALAINGGQALAAQGNADDLSIFGGADPLPAEEAFVPTVAAFSRDQLTVTFAITNGYYLYRDKLGFALTDAGNAELGKPEMPEAIVVEDEFFGKTATYRDSAELSIPLSVDSTTQAVTLDIKFQGCADIGICYPPVTSSFTVKLPALVVGDSSEPTIQTNQSVNTGASDLSARTQKQNKLGNTNLEALFGNTSGATSELLSPDVAYTPFITSANNDGIVVSWKIESGYYLYRDKLKFTLESSEDLQITSVESDTGEIQHDEFFGDVAVWRDRASSVLSIDKLPADGSAELLVDWQGCADIGVCFPPQVTRLPVLFDQADVAALAVVADTSNGTVNSAPANKLVSTAASNAPQQSEQDRLSQLLGNSSLWLNALTFFGLGLLLAFTPCVLPMIPILSSLIVGQGDKITTGRAFRLSLVYVLVMAVTYAAVGIAVGLSGYNVQAFLQNPWILSALALLFVVLSLSMFGFYELQMPTGLQQKLSGWSNKQKGGSVGGVAAMGFISTLIVGPCVTAPLTGALIYIANTGDAVIGGVALFSLGLGMGAPLLLIGTSAGSLVPRSGVWMNKVKAVFGVLMLAMAIWMLSRFLPANITFALAGTLALVSGIHFGATDTLTKDSNGGARFAKGVGMIVSLYGLALLIGTLAGGSSWTTPLRGLAMSSGSGSAVSEEAGLQFQSVKGVDGLEAVVAEASAQGKPVMLDFYADWCISCKEMEAFTFTDPAVQRLLENAVLVQADVTANDAQDQALLKHFGLFGPPGIIFYDANGVELEAARVVGFMKAELFSAHISSFQLYAGL